METKRIYRSRTDRVIGGVCSGIGNYFGMDPVLIRVLWAVAFFVGGAGLLAYIIAWIIIPEDPVA
jgi:phage shock protein PspC (stress-responsive transcriptional regulator)